MKGRKISQYNAPLMALYKLILEVMEKISLDTNPLCLVVKPTTGDPTINVLIKNGIGTNNGDKYSSSFFKEYLFS